MKKDAENTTSKGNEANTMLCKVFAVLDKRIEQFEQNSVDLASRKKYQAAADYETQRYALVCIKSELENLGKNCA